MNGETTSAPSNYTSSQNNLTAGGDIITHLGVAPTGGNGGRVRAVTVSVEKNPLIENCWNVKVSNGTPGPITGLVVDVYSVDDFGNRTTDQCVPAKERISISQVFENLAGQALEGTLGAMGSRAQMYPGFPPGAAAGLGSYGRMLASALTSDPTASARLRQAQASMTDSFPEVLYEVTTAEVVFFAEGVGQVRADIAFDDEDGTRWTRRFGEPPQKVG
ncbi:hypothetical protein ABZ894_26230 [Nocardia beijingensis]|uniref:hypothetical protein n=1 Tax=Nocardia beijingensis TaxID=95162 RepID=UPI0033ECA495